MADSKKKKTVKKSNTQVKKPQDTVAQMPPKSAATNVGEKKNDSMASAVIPYVLMVLAVILAISFVTVQLLGYGDDGAE